MAKDYKLIPEAVPGVIRSTVYAEILTDFSQGKEKSVRVDIPKRKSNTVYVGLQKAKKSDKAFAGITIYKRVDKVYLSK